VTEQYGVAIVCYGPAGQTLAIRLVQRGWQIGVFKRQLTPYQLPRAVHFDHEDDAAGRDKCIFCRQNVVTDRRRERASSPRGSP